MANRPARPGLLVSSRKTRDLTSKGGDDDAQASGLYVHVHTPLQACTHGYMNMHTHMYVHYAYIHIPKNKNKCRSVYTKPHGYLPMGKWSLSRRTVFQSTTCSTEFYVHLNLTMCQEDGSAGVGLVLQAW